GDGTSNLVNNCSPSPDFFTGKERDSETGLDYFGARFYANQMGRWMSPDWSSSQTPVPFADLADPQTLNLYGYVRNNPVLRADIDGHGWWHKFKNWANDGGWTEDDKQAAGTRHQRQVNRARFYANEWAKEHPKSGFDPGKYSDQQILDAFNNG